MAERERRPSAFSLTPPTPNQDMVRSLQVQLTVLKYCFKLLHQRKCHQPPRAAFFGWQNKAERQAQEHEDLALLEVRAAEFRDALKRARFAANALQALAARADAPDD